MRKFLVQRHMVALLVLLMLLLSGCVAAPPAEGWSGVVLDNNALFVGGPTGHIYKMASTDGAKGWEFPADPQKNIGRVYASPVISKETVYIGGTDKNVYALNMANGTLRWQWSIGDDAIYAPAQLSPDGSLVYWATGNGHVYAQDAASGGDPKWQFRAGQGIWGQPVIDAQRGQLYVASFDRNLYALDLKTGEVRWKTLIGSALPAAPVMVGDTLVLGAFDRKLHALSAADGHELWTIDIDNWIFSQPVVSGDVIYFGAVDHNVYAVSVSKKAILWKTTTGGRVVGGVALSPDGKTLYTGDEDQRVYALDTATGNTVWKSEQLSNKIFMRPAVSQDLVYVTTLDQHVYAVDAKTGARRWMVNLAESNASPTPKPAGG